MYSSLMMEQCLFPCTTIHANPVFVWSRRGVAQLPDATRSTQVPRPHTRLPLSLSLAYPHLPRDCAWSPLVVVAPACSRDATQHLQTHVTTMPKSSAATRRDFSLPDQQASPGPGCSKEGEGRGVSGATAHLGSTFYVLLYVLSQGHQTRKLQVDESVS